MPNPVPDDVDRRTFLAATGATIVASTAVQAQQEKPLAPTDKQSHDATMPAPPQKKAGWAIVGLGKLALEQVLPAFARAHRSQPVALVSGHAEKAKQVAASFEIDPKAIYSYDNYDGLKDNPAVDVVYIILPNSMHAEYTVRALKAGKHVLCEKPMASDVAECEQMIAAAKTAKRKLMIAYRLRYEPFHITAIEACRKGTLGKLKVITATNSQIVQAPNIRLSKTLAGGPVGDVGIYCLNAARYLTGEEPTEVTAIAHQPKDDPRFREVPESVAFTLRFPSGVIANLDCSFGTAETRLCRIIGTEGILNLDNAFAYRGQRFTVQTAKQKAEVKIAEVDHFAAEMDYFSECVLDGKQLRTPGEEGLADMRVIAAIAESIKTGKAVKI